MSARSCSGFTVPVLALMAIANTLPRSLSTATITTAVTNRSTAMNGTSRECTEASREGTSGLSARARLRLSVETRGLQVRPAAHGGAHELGRQARQPVAHPRHDLHARR